MEMEGLPVYANGTWSPDAERAILDALKRWQGDLYLVPLADDRIMFYCYDCGVPEYVPEEALRRGYWPQCPFCGEEMEVYNSLRLRRWRGELAGRVKTALSRVLHAFSEVAEKCGGTKGWALLVSGVLEVNSDCAKFWYDPRDPERPGIVATLYSDVPEVRKALERVADELDVWLFYTVKK